MRALFIVYLFIALVASMLWTTTYADAVAAPFANVDVGDRIRRQPGAEARRKKKERAAAADDDTPVDPRDDMIKYKGLLACRSCEDMVEKLALLHHTTPMPASMQGVHDRRSKDRKLLAALETRNAELLDGLCDKMIQEAAKNDDKGSLQMLQLHCESVMGGNEERFGKFLTTLATNSSRLYVPVGQHKDDKTGRITPKFAYEHESDKLCKKYCVEKNSMKDQVSKMKDEIRRKQQEHIDNMPLSEIFKEAFGLLAQYWYVSVPLIVVLTGLGLFVQIRFMAPRDDKGRPITNQKGVAKGYVAPSAGRRLGEGKKDE